ncbi:M23 family metallopeptidase [Novosphingobium huizhouense]|uniref:M23 family metallopeptidase n=1 Tax=Novosphingobium huizhouense TaxID=2866625 RepID=UPI001CD8688F|nr:M23 family metallopeptidase [Novosphingobium huizhouense]
MKRAAALVLALAAAPALHAAPGETPIVAWQYVVRAGDSFAAIARRMGVTQKDLAAANALPYPWTVTPGQVLRRPDPPGQVRQAIPPTPLATPTATPAPAPKPKPQPSPKPPRRPPPPPRPMPSARPLPEPIPAHAREADAPRLAWPTSGAVVGRFGVPVKGRPDNGPNRGMDLAAFSGMTVHAAAAGRVVFAGTEPERFGQLIVIDHGNGWTTAYAYLGAITVSEGQQVTARQVIARIGRSGEATAPTLHFEVRRANVPRDPYAYLPVRL